MEPMTKTMKKGINLKKELMVFNSKKHLIIPKFSLVDTVNDFIMVMNKTKDNPELKKIIKEGLN